MKKSFFTAALLASMLVVTITSAPAQEEEEEAIPTPVNGQITDLTRLEENHDHTGAGENTDREDAGAGIPEGDPGYDPSVF